MELVSKYHPDVYKGDKIYAERYTAVINEAYSILKDPEKRRDYDIRHNINSKPTRSQLRREDSFIRKEKQEEKRLSRKNYEQQMSMRYFKNTERKRTNRKGLLLRILTSKLFYCLLFVFGLEFLIILLIYSR